MATESPSSSRKVIVQLKATADAPILKQNKFKIPGTDKFAKVIDFLRRQLHRETVFVYINSAFSPNPDELVIDLFNMVYSLRTKGFVKFSRFFRVGLTFSAGYAELHCADYFMRVSST